MTFLEKKLEFIILRETTTLVQICKDRGLWENENKMVEQGTGRHHSNRTDLTRN
jgi:hypothetical protein